LSAYFVIFFYFLCIIARISTASCVNARHMATQRDDLRASCYAIAEDIFLYRRITASSEQKNAGG